MLRRRLVHGRAGERKRKSFSGTTKQEVNQKMKAYVADFGKQISASDEAKKKLRDSMQTWLEVCKFPTVERTTYDRAECTAKNQIYPLLGDMIVAEITAKEIRHFLNTLMNDGYASTFSAA